jgi:hypothetical protein
MVCCGGRIVKELYLKSLGPLNLQQGDAKEALTILQKPSIFSKL